MTTKTNIEIARILATSRHCALSREQVHRLADALECKKYKKGERLLDENRLEQAVERAKICLTREIKENGTHSYTKVFKAFE